MDKKLKQALLIGPSYGSDLPRFCQPLKGVHNDVLLMKEMLTRNGFLLENIKVWNCFNLCAPSLDTVNLHA